MILEAFAAITKLGLPVACLSWLILSQLYNNGKLDRKEDRKSVAASLKAIKKSRRKEKRSKLNLLQMKWMQFGGGFYGSAALWTFICIEILEIYSLVFNFPGFEKLFENGFFKLLVSLALNQIGNFVNAIVWFHYWSDNRQSVWIWILVGYAGYLLGMTVAKQNLRFNFMQ